MLHDNIDLIKSIYWVNVRDLQDCKQVSNTPKWLELLNIRCICMENIKSLSLIIPLHYLVFNSKEIIYQV